MNYLLWFVSKLLYYDIREKPSGVVGKLPNGAKNNVRRNRQGAISAGTRLVQFARPARLTNFDSFSLKICSIVVFKTRTMPSKCATFSVFFLGSDDAKQPPLPSKTAFVGASTPLLNFF